MKPLLNSKGKTGSLQAVARSGNWVVLDVETTGLGRMDDVVQLGVVACDGRVLMDTLVCPYSTIPAAATAVHGITNEMVARAPVFTRVAGQLRRHIEGMHVFAYVSSFDSRMLRQTCALYDMPEIEVAGWHDVAGWYKEFSRRSRWCKLLEACGEMGIKLNGAHTAVGDALATRELVLRMVKR